MHIPLTFQLIIKWPFFFQTSSILRSIPTNKPHYVLFKNYNSHQSITYPSYFYHLFTQLLLHHNSHVTNSISFFTPPQLISLSINPQHPCSLSSPPHLLRTTHINHQLSLFFTNFSPFPLRLPPSHIQTSTSDRPSGLPMQGCTFLLTVGRWNPPQIIW